LREFQVFVTDDRYSIPTLCIVQAPSVARARELAEGIFADSLHHLGVELLDDGECILTLGVITPAKDTGPPPPQGRGTAGDPQG
jgi:hypothetical protein